MPDTPTPTADDMSLPAEELSLPDMLRVMDVARALRKERETVEREFSRDETRAVLRERMLKTTAITGEELSEAEVDAALDLYFDNLHTFRPPASGLSTMFAHLWIYRRAIGLATLLLATVGLIGWLAWPRPIDPLTEAYDVRIVSHPGEVSGIDRYFTDEQGTRQPAYYVIVEAVTPDGDVLRRRIRNSETGRTSTVTRWAERVPEAVYTRIMADKLVDGVLDETSFAVKRSGEPDLDVVIEDLSGTPIKRGGQITDW